MSQQEDYADFVFEYLKTLPNEERYSLLNRLRSEYVTEITVTADRGEDRLRVTLTADDEDDGIPLHSESDVRIRRIQTL